MQDDTALAVRSIPPRLAAGLRMAALDRGISQTDIVKLALWDWLARYGYVQIHPGAPTHPQPGADTGAERE